MIYSKYRKNMHVFILIITCVISLIISCRDDSSSPDTVFIGQGIMAGEVSASSVILQARLTQSDTLISNDLPGSEGVGYFEISTGRDFSESRRMEWMQANPGNDYILKRAVKNLTAGQKYYYRLVFGPDRQNLQTSHIGQFKTLQGMGGEQDISFVVVTGMNYARHFYGRHDGIRKSWEGYNGPDRELGFPALEAILNKKSDFFVGTGDNVYYDRNGPGQKTAENQEELRQRWHEQFIQPRFIKLFAQIPTYWEKDDHDHRYNDSDPHDSNKLPSHELGVNTFLEQLPVVDPEDVNPKTYRTYRINNHLQVWFTEGRDYRSPNRVPDGPEKTMWGKEQKRWLKQTLLSSDASLKILISPTSLVGPDDWGNKRDNHLNAYRHERKEFFNWLVEHNFPYKNFYIICGDRHWQYHALDPTGIEEFSCGALVDGNARHGVKAGDPNSTDPEGTIKQLYLQPEPSGGFLHVSVKKSHDGLKIVFTHFDENGVELYRHEKKVKSFGIK